MSGMKSPKPKKRKKRGPINQPWERPPKPEIGDPSPSHIFHAVGAALATWETIEERTAKLFAAMISPNDPSFVAMRAFGTISTARGRAEMLAAASAAHFLEQPNPRLEHTIAVVARAISGYAARRNEFAHGAIRTRGRKGKPGFFLAPPYYATSKIRLDTGSLYIYNSTQILEFTEHFASLGEVIDNLLWRFDVWAFAARTYGGKLSPSQSVRLDWLLQYPTARIPKSQPQSYRA